MDSYTTVFRAECRARSYDEEDEHALKDALGPLGGVRLRRLEIPEAGGSYEIWLAVEFVGASIASGLIAHVAASYYDELSARLKRFFVHRRKRKIGTEMTLKISYDDIDIVFTEFNEADLSTLPDLGRLVLSHLDGETLMGRNVTSIKIGMSNDQGVWQEPGSGNGLIGDKRFWGLSFSSLRVTTHIYDTQTRLLSENASRY